MTHFGWTLEEVRKLDMVQIELLLKLIKKDKEAEARAYKRALRRRH